MKLFFSSRSKKKPESDVPAAEKDSPAPTEPASQKASTASAESVEKPEPQTPSSELTDTAEMRALLGDSTDLSEFLDDGVDPGTDHASDTPASDDREFVLYRRLLNGLYDAVLLVDAKGTIFCGNRRAEKFFGYADDEFWNKPVEKLVRGVNAKILFKIRNHTDTGRFTVIKAVCKRKDETIFPAEIAINNIGLFNTDDMIFSIRNMERREKSREQQSLRDDAIRGAGTAIAVCNTDGLIEFANPAFVKMAGATSEDDVLKRFMGDFFTSNEAVNALVRTPSESGFWMGNLAMVTTDHGQPRHVRALSNLAPAHPGAPNRLVVTLTPMPQASIRTTETP